MSGSVLLRTFRSAKSCAEDMSLMLRAIYLLLPLHGASEVVQVVPGLGDAVTRCRIPIAHGPSSPFPPLNVPLDLNHRNFRFVRSGKSSCRLSVAFSSHLTTCRQTAFDLLHLSASGTSCPFSRIVCIGKRLHSLNFFDFINSRC